MSLSRILLDSFLVAPYKAIDPIAEKCDKVFLKSYSADKGMVGVIIYDNVPLWCDPINKDTVGYFGFADTVKILSLYSMDCNREICYKVIHKDSTASYVAGHLITETYVMEKDLLSIYFKAAEINISSDTVVTNRFAALIEEKFPNDTTVLDYAESSLLLSGRSAADMLELWKYSVFEDYKKEFLQGLKIIKNEKSFKELRIDAAYHVLNLIERQLDTKSLSKVDMIEYLKFLAETISSPLPAPHQAELYSGEDLYAAKIILRNWNTFLHVSTEKGLLDILRSSKNNVVILLAIQMESALAITKDNLAKAEVLLTSSWRKYGNIKEIVYDNLVNHSLTPFAVTIDSLIMQTHDYRKTLSFIEQLKTHLSSADSTLANFLNAKTYQLCIESDCPNMDYTFRNEYYFSHGMGTYDGLFTKAREIQRLQSINESLRPEIVVKKGTTIKDGVYGKKVKVLAEDLKGKILFEYNYLHNGYHPAKIKSNEGVFWVDKDDTTWELGKPIFSKSMGKSEQITKPVVKEVLPFSPRSQYVLMDINKDGILDFISNSEYALDGRTRKTLWKHENMTAEQRHAIIINADMYIQDRQNSLSKRSIMNEPKWTVEYKFQNQESLAFPVMKYKSKIFAFTYTGHLMEVDDIDGTLISTYKFPGSISTQPILFENELYFVLQTTDQNKRDTLYSIDLDTRLVTSLTSLRKNGRLTQMQVDSGHVYFNEAMKIVALNKFSGTVSLEFNVRHYPESFILSNQRILVYSSRLIEAFDVNKPAPIWMAAVDDLYTNMVIEGNFIYACSKDYLFVLSLSTGDILAKLSLPDEVMHGRELLYHQGSLLLPGSRYLMVIGQVE